MHWFVEGAPRFPPRPGGFWQLGRGLLDFCTAGAHLLFVQVPAAVALAFAALVAASTAQPTYEVQVVHFAGSNFLGTFNLHLGSEQSSGLGATSTVQGEAWGKQVGP